MESCLNGKHVMSSYFDVVDLQSFSLHVSTGVVEQHWKKMAKSVKKWLDSSDWYLTQKAKIKYERTQSQSTALRLLTVTGRKSAALFQLINRTD